MRDSKFNVVLMIEDNRDDGDLTIRSLRKNNLVNDIKWIEDGQEALDYLLEEGKYKSMEPETPRVILLDLKLPKVNGLQILEKLKKNDKLKKIPVVILTSSKEDNDIKKAYELGANSYIVKPVDFNKFAEAIKNLGVYWMHLNENP